MKQLSGLVVGLLMGLLAGASAAQSYPVKPIHLVVGFPAGSQPDFVARVLAEQLSATLGKPVVVENLAGAAGNIAADHVAKAAADGYTIGLLSQTHLVVNPSLYKLPYDPVKDFAPVSQVAVSPYVLVVHEAVPATTVNQLIALAKARPGELTFASAGTGTGGHIATELFNVATAVDIRHIPYKGIVAAIPDLIAGRVTMMFSPIAVVLPLVREGKLRMLAVTSSTRSPTIPDVPTVAESGYPRFEATNWYGVLAPAGTPTNVVARLHDETVKALGQPDVRKKLADLGLDVIGNSPEAFAAVIKLEIPQWTRVIRESGIKPD